MSYLDQSLYGLWGRVIVNIVIMLIFVLSIFKPKTKKEWRSLGAFTAFLVALFSEMYGFPLTIYFLTSILGNKYPVLDPFTHINGHLWVAFSGGSRLVFSILHPISNIVILLGLFIIAVGWKAIHSGNGELVDYGIYKYIRHPQYSGFVLIIIGFLIQWPTIITLLMAPILLIVYRKLAKHEEKVMIENFNEKYLAYKDIVPAFVPNKIIRIRDLFQVN
ncbi:isoprenylcysteine carboxylmethyltransferase family protein [Wukongibacter baidiensis]|uniref:methyltransferase family protein n=1 Tax=Wukongibacter baidiensis TaxID=1723361 RepID=UPI003D7FA384